MAKVFILPDGKRIREQDTALIAREITRVEPAATKRDDDGNERIEKPAREIAELQEFNAPYAALVGMDKRTLKLFGITIAEDAMRGDPALYEQSEGAIVDGKIQWNETPRPVEPMKEAARQRIKDEAGRVIRERFPDWQQANMLARGLELMFKLGRAKELTEAEAEEAAQLEKDWAWIKAVRARSDVLEDQAAKLSKPEDLRDFQAKGWPK